MNWLENNPVGALLAGTTGLLVLIGLALTFAWGGAPSTGLDGLPIETESLAQLPGELEALGPMKDYQVIIDRPVFNDTRRPVIVQIDEGDEEPETAELSRLTVADAPEVRLTGVVITPEHRVVTLTPANGGEAVVVREGMPLEGEYVGWSVSRVGPREAQLTSTDGDTVDVQLSVHDEMITEPPKPQMPEEARVAETASNGEATADEATLSRAEEIRQRIQERREQLRAEAAAQQEDDEDEQASTRKSYQEAIQAMMKRSDKDEESNDDGNE